MMPGRTKYGTYIKSTTVYVPSSELGLFHPPLSPASVPLPPEPKGGGTLACGWGVGGVPIPTTGEKLSSLPTLWLDVSATLLYTRRNGLIAPSNKEGWYHMQSSNVLWVQEQEGDLNSDLLWSPQILMKRCYHYTGEGQQFSWNLGWELTLHPSQYPLFFLFPVITVSINANPWSSTIRV